jgi:membrane protein implicated in regulation of membrane protease activity
MQFGMNTPQGIKVIKLPRWAVPLIAVCAAAIGIVLFVLAASFALVLFPIILVVAMIGGWWMRRKLRREFAATSANHPRDVQGRSGQGHGTARRVIEGEYQVLPPGDKTQI